MSTIQLVNTGDFVMIGPTEGNESVGQRMIQLTGSVHVHDEPVYVDPTGEVYVASAQCPHLVLIPLRERIRECEEGKSNMLICRLSRFMNAPFDQPEYVQYRTQMESVIRFAAEELKIPYDCRGIVSHGRNWLRAKFGIARKVVKQSEYKVWCTEFVFMAPAACGVYLRAYLPPQAFVCPVHMERLYHAGVVQEIVNMGLKERLPAPAVF